VATPPFCPDTRQRIRHTRKAALQCRLETGSPVQGDSLWSSIALEGKCSYKNLTAFIKTPLLPSINIFIPRYRLSLPSNLFIYQLSTPSHSRWKVWRQFVRKYQCGSHWTVFREVWSVEKLQIWLKSGKNVKHFACLLKYVLLLPMIINRHKSALVQRNGIGLLRQHEV